MKTQALEPPKILCVEDDLDMQRMLQVILEGGGFNVKFAGKGAAGVKAANIWQPDLILMDLMLPDVSGLEVTKYLHQQRLTHNIPVIVLSAYGDESTCRQAKQAGAVDCLEKSIRPSLLLQTVKHLLAKGEPA